MKKIMSFLFAAVIYSLSFPSLAADKAAMEETNPPPASGPLDSSSIPIPAETMPKPQNPAMTPPPAQPAMTAPPATSAPPATPAPTATMPSNPQTMMPVNPPPANLRSIDAQ